MRESGNTQGVFRRTKRKANGTPSPFGSRPQSEANTDTTVDMKVDDIEEEEESLADLTGMAGGINARTLEAILRDQKDRQRRYEKKATASMNAGGTSSASTSLHGDDTAGANGNSPQNHNQND